MRGNNLYWGPASNGFDTPPIPFSGKQATITLPEKIQSFDQPRMKASYHQSGQFHIKKIFNNKSDLISDRKKWRAKDKIVEPFRFCTIITKVISLYEHYGHSLTRRRTHAIVYRIPKQCRDCRYYFEFFLSREGEYHFPEPLIETKTPVQDNLKCFSFNLEYILVIREMRFPSNHSFNRFRPDVEFSFFCDDIQ